MDVELVEDDETMFPDKDLQPMLNWLAVVIDGLLPGESFNLWGTQNRKRIKICLQLADESKIGLFMGPKRRVARSVLSLCRFQQLCRHNRYLELHVIKLNEQDDVIVDRDVFTRKNKD